MTNSSRIDLVGVGLNAIDTLIPLPHYPALGSKVEFRSANILPGGQVASAVMACQQWGLRTRYVGKVGEDRLADIHRAEFAKAGVEAHLFTAAGCASQQAFILVDDTGERTVLWKRDNNLTLRPAEIKREWIVEARALHVDGHDTAAAIQAATWAKASGVPVIADLDEVYPGVQGLLGNIDYLIASNRHGLGDHVPAFADGRLDAAGKAVVVIGGGWGGATAAKYLRLSDPSIDVVLLEPNDRFVSCPFSNLVLSGVRSMGSITFEYRGLRRHGVRLINREATAIEPDTKRVRIGEGYLQYDRLIVAPGVEFQWEQVDGLAQAKDTVLHAWKAGPQTVELARQLQSMADGGVFVLTVPPVAYRCPPGPYERACQVAWYLKTHKPRAKLIVLDANQNIVSKTALFRAAWQAYPNIDYRASQKVIGVDTSTREVRTEFDRVKYDVLNLIPPQRAGAIAVQADLVGADKRWCEVDHVTYESVKQKNIHVIGDATIGLPVPKSGNVANNMGKAAALSIVSMLNGQAVPLMPPGNTCYSWVSDREAIAVVNSYKIENGKVVQIEQKLTPAQSVGVAQRSLGWAQSIWNDVLA